MGRKRADHVDPSRLKEARVGAKLTGVRLAEILQVSRTHLSRIETGQSCPSRELLEKFARACGVDVWLLYRGAPLESEVDVSPLEATLLERLRKLPENIQNQIVGVVLGLSSSGPTGEQMIREMGDTAAELADALRRSQAGVSQKRTQPKSR